MRLEKVDALRRVVMKREVTLVPVRADLGLTVTVTLATVSSLFFLFSGIYWKKTKLIKKN